MWRTESAWPASVDGTPSQGKQSFPILFNIYLNPQKIFNRILIHRLPVHTRIKASSRLAHKTRFVFGALFLHRQAKMTQAGSTCLGLGSRFGVFPVLQVT